jgi:Zn-dependent protease with chaperone function
VGEGQQEVPPDDRDARRYHRLQLVLELVGLLLTVLYLLGALAGGAGHALARAARTWAPAFSWQVAVTATGLGAGHGLLLFPIAWVQGYWLPRRYGLLHQSLGGWLADRAKAAAVGGVLGLTAVELIYLLMGSLPVWWLTAGAALVAMQVLLAFVFPVWLVPLFYRLVPLADEDLRRRLLALAARAGVTAVGVWVADQSRKSRTANAALAGLGQTRRILLFDTLVARFTPAEVESVLAHELAHHVHRDVWRGLAVQAALTVLALWIADRLLQLGVSLWGLEGPADPAGLPWLALVLLGVGLVTMPLVNAWSRRLERQADDFALQQTGDIDAFVGAMQRLASLNLAERRPHWLKEVLFYSHPSIDRRIARAFQSSV